MSALVAYLLLFVVVGIGFILVHLLVGKLIRPAKPHAEKLTIYECGEPTIGSSWIQFDLRFYVIALLFVIFDVEVAFFFPWAAVFGQANTLAAEHSPAEARAQAYLDLASPGDARAERIRKLLAEVQTKTVSEADLNSELAPVGPVASRVAWLAFWDILIFFGVLIVGFAYLWRRGDLDWVRSLAAERAAMPPAGTSNQAGLPPELTPVGQW